MTMLVVFVLGRPAPQGSKRHVGNGRMVESSKELPAWRENVTYQVRAAMKRDGWSTVDEACELRLTFFVHRPPSAPRKRIRPDRKPDIDKLARAVLDALTAACAVADDARVVSLTATKLYASADQPPGVHIALEATT